MSGTHGVLADVMTASEMGEGRNVGTVLNEVEFVDADQAQSTNASRELYSLLARYAGSEAAAIVRSVTGLGRRRSVEPTAHHLRQKKKNVPCATRMHESNSREGRKSSEGGDHAGLVEENDDGVCRRRDDARSVSKRCERSNANKAGRDRRKPRESQDESDL